MWSATPTRGREDPLWVFGAVAGVVRDWVARFFAVQAFDRAMSISAYAYTALFPLLIVYASLLPRTGNKSFADVLVERFDLTGPTAQSVQLAFAPAGHVRSSVTALGAVLLLVSALSFSRGMQRLYEAAYGLPNLGMRNTLRGLLWLAILAVVAVLRPVVTGPFSGWARLAVTLALAIGLWLLTPYLLLGRRVRWGRLVPTSLITAVGMTGVGIWSVLWMPRAFTASAQQFGIAGIGFAIMSWLFAVSVIVVVATAGGAMIADRLERRDGA